MKIYFFLAITCFSLMGNAEIRKIKVKKAPRRPAQSTGEAQLANMSFLGFLKCSGSRSEKETLTCMKPYFSTKLSEGMILRYSEALDIASEYSELFYCDENRKKIIENLIEKDYDFFLCFQSNVTGSREHEGVVFFQKNDGMPKILRIRM